MKVTVTGSSQVRPTVPTPQEVHWLSNLDIIIFRTHASVYFYRNEDPAWPDDFFNPQIMKSALSEVLVPFYPMAGRLGRDSHTGRMELRCNGEGVLFVEASADSTIAELGDLVPSLDLLKLMPKLEYKEDISHYPLVMYQVTRFRCGGVSLGVRMQHTAADGKAALELINQWARAARGEKISVKPCLDRSFLRARNPPTQPVFPHMEFQPPPTLIKRATADKTSQAAAAVTGEGYASKIYCFTQEHIQRLKLEAAATASISPTTPTGPTPIPTTPTTPVTPGGFLSPFSTYEVLAGHVWRCICEARKLWEDEASRMYINTDGRSRLNLPLPPLFFGNAIFPATPTARVGDLLTLPLSFAASQIQKTLRRMDDTYLRSALDYLEVMPDLESLHRASDYFRSPNLSVTSWYRLPIYDADFGWGRPVYMGPAHPYEGRVYILESPSQKGGERAINVIVTLTPDQLSRFDQLIFA